MRVTREQAVRTREGILDAGRAPLLDQGVIKVRTTTLNQNDESLQVFVGNLIVLRRHIS